jgi:hypothetical protein
MKATHKLTYLPDGDKYLFSVVGDSFHWSTKEDTTWRGPFSTFTENYLQNQNWMVVKINVFKGNK